MLAQRVVVVVAAGAGMLATFLPWVSFGGIGAVAGSGMGGDGWFTLCAFALALGCAFVGTRTAPLGNGARFAIVLVGLVDGLAGLYLICHVHEIEIVQIGPGLYLEFIAALVTTGAASWILPNGHPLPSVFAIVVAIGVVFAGAVHITYGTNYTGPSVCSKGNWSLVNTFVDFNDYLGQPRTGSNARVMDALVKCGALHFEDAPAKSDPNDAPAPPPLPDPSIGSRCVVENADTVGNTVTGVCRDLSDCVAPAVYYQGYCPGPASQVCCVTHQ